MSTATTESPRAPTAARVQKSNDAHWYTPAGDACHEVPTADGKRMRKTTIADARKLGLFPSVTTIISDILAKPALTAWLVEQACNAVLTAPRRDGEGLDAFVKRVLQDERQQDEERDAAAALGTNIHGAVENALRTGSISPAMPPGTRLYVEPVVKCHILAKTRLIASETTIVGDGYAGKFDYLGDDGEAVNLVDFKTAKTVPDPKYGPWDEHKIQLSAYAKAITTGRKFSLGDRRLRCWNVYISTTTPGLVVPMEVTGWEEIYENAFLPLLKVWQWKKSYKPSL